LIRDDEGRMMPPTMKKGSRAKRTVPRTALVTRTSGEMLGGRPLPRVVSGRPVLFVLGPVEVGKTTVARRVLGAHPLERSGAALNKALTHAARYRKWPAEYLEAPGLLLDGVERLHGRFGPISLIGDLLRARSEAGRRTVFCQGPNDESVTLLYPEVPLELGATLLLRFPVGRGRKRYVAERCRARGIRDCSLAKPAVLMEPWSYARVETFLDRLVDS
jgi:hypothetical protein